MQDENEEAEWIGQAQRGDMTALALLLQRHYSFLIRYFMKITLQPEWAQDLTQETMLRCMEKIKLYNGQTRFSSWLVTIGTRIYIDGLRKRKRERRLIVEEQTLHRLKWQIQLAGEDWPEVLEALGHLDEGIRLPIVLKHYYGYTYGEIAAIMDLPEGTVKSRVHNGLGLLRKELKKDGEQ